jgi:pyruvate-formate lyase-activating enzyme
VFDYIAKLVMDAPEEQRELVFLRYMKPYLQTESATERWKKLNALANAYAADFQELVAYFERHKIPAKHRAPRRS